jgi:type IV secretory pathway VirB10-like protein
MMFGKVTFVAVLMILSAMVFASLRGPRVADFVTNGGENSRNSLRRSRPERMSSLERRSTAVASLGDSSAADAGGAMPMAPQPATAPYARRAPIAAAAPPQLAAPADSSDQQMNNDDNSNDNDSNDNDNSDSSDDRNSNSNDDNDNSGDQAMNNQGADEQSNNPFSQEVPPGMWRTPNGQLMPQITPPAIAPFPPRLTNN